MARNSKIAVPTGTKSDRFRSVLRANAADPSGAGSIASAAETVGIGYAFAYGIAKRTPDPDVPGKSYAATRASRRGTKSVSTADGFVSVRIVGTDGTVRGMVRVDTRTGAVTRPKIGR
jgi:hypothetical protein